MNITDRVKNALQSTRSHSLQEVKKEFLDLIQKRFPSSEADYEDDTLKLYGRWHCFELDGPAEVDDPDQQIIEWIDENKNTIVSLTLSELNPIKLNSCHERGAMAEGFYNV